MAKTPPTPPTAAPWVVAPPSDVDPTRVDTDREVEDFLDEVTRPALWSEAAAESDPEPVSRHEPAPLSVAPLYEAELAMQGIEIPPVQPYTPVPVAPPARLHREVPAPRPRQEVVYEEDRTYDAGRSTDTDWRKDAVQPVAESGWRRWVYYASGKTLNLGENPAEVSARDLDRKIQTPIEHEFSVAVVQLKGGSAKTTSTVGLGNAFAEVRSDAVLAVDANPDRGNLARRGGVKVNGTSVFTLLGAPHPRRGQEVRVHTNKTPAGLEILASAQDPAGAQSFSAQDYDQAFGIVKDFYSLILSDCGTNITHAATSAALGRADVVVIPLDAKNDSADEAVAAINYLHNAYAKDPETIRAIVDEAGNRQWLYRHLLARTVVVVSHQRPGRRMFDVDKSLAWFKERVADVHVIPYDPHLEESAEIVPHRLSPATRLAYRELAAKIAAHFPSTYSADTTLRRGG